MEEWIVNLLVPLLQKYPWFSSAMMIVGILRLLMKPLMTFLQTMVDATPYDQDNQWLKDAQASKFYKGLCYFLDWTASIKLPEKEEKK